MMHGTMNIKFSGLFLFHLDQEIGFNCQQGQDIFLSSTAFRPTLKPTWVMLSSAFWRLFLQR